MTLAPVKRLGCCLGCDTEVYDVVQYFPADHPFFPGHPQRVGAMKPEGTQIELLMSDGSAINVTFCIECAQAVTPAVYGVIWRLCIERTLLSLRAAGRRENDLRMQNLGMTRLYPVALLRKLREGVEAGTLVVDRR